MKPRAKPPFPDKSGRPQPGKSAPLAALEAQLETMAADDNIPAASRATALRTLAEMRGLIGRHQTAPGQDTASQGIAGLSRPELETELARLRAHVLGPDAAPSPAQEDYPF